MLEVSRTGLYYEPKTKTKEAAEREEKIKSRIDFWHTQMSYLGARRLSKKLWEEDGLRVGRKLVKRYMTEMGIYCVYPKPNLSKNGKEHRRFPYLLRNIDIFMPNQVWAIDITYIKMGRTHMYLTAILDWHSRYIVGWELSDSLDTAPVLEALKKAISEHGIPAIINSDQGSQFTSEQYMNYLSSMKIRQSMDGRARWVDNVRIERWFRSLKCDCIYVNEFNTPRELRQGIRSYVEEYNNERPHEGLDFMYPVQVYKSAFVA